VSSSSRPGPSDDGRSSPFCVTTLGSRRVASPPRPRGRPRDDAVDARVVGAAFGELAAGGISHFSVAAVARRAGVARGTVYLRWPTREALILAASQRLVSGIAPPAPGTLAAQLGELADQWADAFAQPGALEVLQRLGADRERHPALYRAIFEHVQDVANRIVLATVETARARGEVRSDVPALVVNRLFVGALFVEALAHTPPRPLDPAFRRDLVAFLVAAVA
jgi:AcrR family transcriptional regulator